MVLSFGYCGSCAQCAAGLPGYCSDFFGLNFGGSDLAGNTALRDADGHALHDHFFAQSSFATYALARENSTVKVPTDVPLELLGPLGCGIQTGAGAVINSLQVRPGTSFACYGAGAVGLSAVMAAKVVGATSTVAIDVVPSRLELAKELGATHTVNSREVDLLGGRSIRGIVEGDSVPRTFIPKSIELHRQGRFPFDKLVNLLAGPDQRGRRGQSPWRHPQSSPADAGLRA